MVQRTRTTEQMNAAATILNANAIVAKKGFEHTSRVLLVDFTTNISETTTMPGHTETVRSYFLHTAYGRATALGCMWWFLYTIQHTRFIRMGMPVGIRKFRNICCLRNFIRWKNVCGIFYSKKLRFFGMVCRVRARVLVLILNSKINSFDASTK